MNKIVLKILIVAATVFSKKDAVFLVKITPQNCLVGTNMNIKVYLDLLDLDEKTININRRNSKIIDHNEFFFKESESVEKWFERLGNREGTEKEFILSLFGRYGDILLFPRMTFFEEKSRIDVFVMEKEKSELDIENVPLKVHSFDKDPERKDFYILRVILKNYLLEQKRDRKKELLKLEHKKEEEECEINLKEDSILVHVSEEKINLSQKMIAENEEIIKSWKSIDSMEMNFSSKSSIELEEVEINSNINSHNEQFGSACNLIEEEPTRVRPPRNLKINLPSNFHQLLENSKISEETKNEQKNFWKDYEKYSNEELKELI
jgi:hypothetical protein